MAGSSPSPERLNHSAACCPAPPEGRLFVASETDRLRTCVVHAPGREIERLIPANYRFHLYDDLLHAERAQREHAVLRALLERLGARVHEFTDLLAGVYEQMSGEDRQRFLKRVHEFSPGAPQYVLRELRRERDPAVVARALIEGVEATASFAAEVADALYHLQPMANLFFMQDAAVVLLEGIVQGYMSQLVRMPEEIVLETVIRQSRVFGPRGTGEFWLDPGFRRRHRMQRTAREHVQLDAARIHVRLGAIDAPGLPLHGLPAKVSADRVHVTLENAFTAEGRHFILEGGNVLSFRRGDGQTVVLIGHNARASADAIDELAYRLLRDSGRDRTGVVGAVVVVDMPDAGEESRHLDTLLLALGPREIAADRSLVQAASGLSARFYVFLPEADGPADRSAPGGEFRAQPKVKLRPCRSFEDALALAHLDVAVRWIPCRVPWEAEGPPQAPTSAAWLTLQQSLHTRALNLLSVAPSVFIGLDRHTTFYTDALGATCLDAESEVLSGALSDLRCCSLLDAIRERGSGRPVVLVIRGDELSRARGGARSLVMPLLREREDPE